MPKRVSMKVKCLFQSSIYTIRMSHSTLLMISQALPKYRPTPSFTLCPNCFRPSHTLALLFLLPCGSDYSKAPAGFINLEKRGERRFLEIIQRMKRRSLVFLLRRTPSYMQCFYLYMAMQVYYSPSLRLLRQTLTRVQQRSGKAASILVKSMEDLMVLLVLWGSSSVRARVKELMNLLLSLYSISCSLRVYGLLLWTSIALSMDWLPALQGLVIIHHTLNTAFRELKLY